MTLPNAEALAAMVEAATPSPWGVEGAVIAPPYYQSNPIAVVSRYLGQSSDQIKANAALIALAPCLAQEVIRLTAVAEDAKRVAAETVQANAALAAECARMGERAQAAEIMIEALKGAFGVAIEELKARRPEAGMTRVFTADAVVTFVSDIAALLAADGQGSAP